MEKHFREKLKEHRVDWQKEDLLDGLESQLSNKNTRAKWKWMLLLLPLLLVMTCLTKHKFASHEMDKDTIAVLDETTNSKKQSTESVVGNSKNADEGNINEVTDPATQQTNHNQYITHATSKSPDLNSENNQSHNLENIQETLAVKNSSYVNASQPPISESFINQNAGISGNGLHQKRSSTIIVYDVTKEDIVQEAITSLASKDDSRNAIPVKTVKTLTSIQNSETKWNGIPSLELRDMRLPDSFVGFDRNLEVKLPDIKQERNIKSLSLFFEPVISLGYFHRSIGVEGDWAPNRDTGVFIDRSNVTPMVFDALSFDMGAVINNKWIVQGGLEYFEFRDYFKYEEVTRSEESIIDYEKAFFIIGMDMDTIFFAGEGQVIESERRIIKHRNRLRYFNIPLSLGKRFRIKQTVVNATVGISYAFKSSYHGRNSRYGPEESIILLTDYGLDMQNKFGWQLGLGTEYPITDRWQFILKANVRRSPRFWLENYYEIYWSYSLGAGMQYVF